MQIVQTSTRQLLTADEGCALSVTSLCQQTRDIKKRHQIASYRKTLTILLEERAAPGEAEKTTSPNALREPPVFEISQTIEVPEEITVEAQELPAPISEQPTTISTDENTGNT